MTRTTINKKRYLEVAQVLHWFFREHIQLMFTGSLERHSRTEKLLPDLVKRKKLVAIKWGQRLIYSVPRRTRSNRNFAPHKLQHGLACTECLVRVWLSKKGELISEKEFSGFSIKPEWGIRYENSLLLFEFSTLDNFSRLKLMKDKVERYLAELDNMTAKFKSSNGIVLFVIDANRDRIKKFVSSTPMTDNFYFTDWATFKSVKYGRQLQEKIYIWKDGREYSLTND